MYGRAAKCPACHQKWFIPHKQEIPTDSTSINLKDHPELLRKAGELVRPGFHDAPCAAKNDDAVPRDLSGDILPPSQLAAQTKDVDSDAPGLPEGTAGENKQDDGDTAPKTPKYMMLLEAEQGEAAQVMHRKKKTPLDVLDPLRLLFSYRAQVECRKKAGDAADRDDIEEKEVLDAYDRSLQRMMSRLHASLDNEFESSMRQCTAIEEDIARASVALRVGDITLEAFLAKTGDLRIQREVLERHCYNLAAWRAVDSPELAGGLMDVRLEEFDTSSFSIALPAPARSTTQSAYLFYGEELAEALRMRAAVERRRAEWHALAADNTFPSSAVKEGIAETETVLDRIKARIRFCHERLERLLLDCDNDLNTLRVYLGMVGERASRGEMSEGARAAVEHRTEQVRANFLRLRALLRKTISANSPEEIPILPDTLLRQINHVSPASARVLKLVLLSALLLMLGAVLLAGIMLAYTYRPMNTRSVSPVFTESEISQTIAVQPEDEPVQHEFDPDDNTLKTGAAEDVEVLPYADETHHAMPPIPAPDDVAPIDAQAEEETAPAHIIAAGAARLRLNGVVYGDAPGPRFLATLQYPDGRTQTLTLQLDDVIHGDWRAAEYNVESKKLTVTNGEQLLILQAGAHVLLH